MCACLCVCVCVCVAVTLLALQMLCDVGDCNPEATIKHSLTCPPALFHARQPDPRPAKSHGGSLPPFGALSWRPPSQPRSLGWACGRGKDPFQNLLVVATEVPVLSASTPEGIIVTWQASTNGELDCKRVAPMSMLHNATTSVHRFTDHKPDHHLSAVTRNFRAKGAVAKPAEPYPHLAKGCTRLPDQCTCFHILTHREFACPGVALSLSCAASQAGRLQA